MNSSLATTRRRYSPDCCPETACRLELLNAAALYDETWRELTFPEAGSSCPRAQDFRRRLDEMIRNPTPESAAIDVWSFDIDLTLAIPEDKPELPGVIPVTRLIELRQSGAVVGACSDREISEQRRVLQALDFEPDFCIPRERLLPDAGLTHVGDDPWRDRAIAQSAGWKHLWPGEFSTSPVLHSKLALSRDS